MPVTQSKHQQQDVVHLGDFTGGVNVAVPATMIKDNECPWIVNMYIDPVSGKMRTRYPIDSHSTTAVDPVGAINGLYYWNSTWYLTSNQVIYRLNGTTATEIGALNGTTKPTFAPYNDQLIVASGGAIQAVSTSHALSDVSGGATAKYIFQRYSRLVASGNTDTPDRIQECTYDASGGDETTWDANDYLDVGYKDGLNVVGVAEWAEGLYVVFKYGAGGLATYFASSLSNTDPNVNLVSSTHAAVNHHCAVNTADRLFILERNYFSAIMGTDRQGKLIVDPLPGYKLGDYFTADSDTAFCVVYPRDFQIWCFPDPASEYAYIYHYLRQAWTIFDFGTVKIHSAYYLPSDGYLYLGASDGLVYKYDRISTNYRDVLTTSNTETSYTQRIKTKIFDPSPTREKVLKKPRLFFYNLGLDSDVSGTNAGSLRIRKAYGRTVAHTETFDISGAYIYVYDTQDGGSNAMYVYDTQEGGDNERRVSDAPASADMKADYNIPLENFQFDVEVTQGGIVIEALASDVALSRSKD